MCDCSHVSSVACFSSEVQRSVVKHGEVWMNLVGQLGWFGDKPHPLQE